MLTFLFWNIQKKPLYHVVAELAVHHDAGVVVVAECHVPAQLLLALNSGDRAPAWHPVRTESKSVTIATRFEDDQCPPVAGLTRRYSAQKRTTVHLLRRRDDPPPGLLLVATHMPDRIDHPKPEDRQTHHLRLMDLVLEAEAAVKHRRTVLVGDLNDDPHTEAVMHPTGLHALMTKDLARHYAEPRTANRAPAFYNPMWGLYGDATPGPPGSHYYDDDRGGRAKPYWHILDQVLVRPDLLDVFDGSSVRILGEQDHPALLAGRGRPAAMSDHLPLVFALKLP